MKSTVKDILRIVCISLLLLLIYTVCDILDLPSRIGIPVQYINWNTAGILCGNLVVIALFAITYRAFDKRNIQKELNRRHIAIYFLRAIIPACQAQVELLKDRAYMSNLIRKIDFSKTLDESPVYVQLLSIPFEGHETISTFAADGVLSEEEISAYYSLKISYHTFVTTSILFHDIEEMKQRAERHLVFAIERAQELLQD